MKLSEECGPTNLPFAGFTLAALLVGDIYTSKLKSVQQKGVGISWLWYICFALVGGIVSSVLWTNVKLCTAGLNLLQQARLYNS